MSDHRCTWCDETPRQIGYSVGGPDTTNEELIASRPTNPTLRTCADYAKPFLCTRPTGHPGPHVAGTGEVVAAVWEGSR